MFYGRILPGPVLSSAHSQSVIVDGDQAWETLSRTMWPSLQPRPSLVNILPALCSAILRERGLHPVRVPRPHRHLLGPFTRPKIAMIFKRGVEGIQSQQQQQQQQKGGPSSVVDGILEAINELEQFPRPQQHPARPFSTSSSPSITTTTPARVADYWTVSQGAYPAWATDLETSPEASFFNERVYHWLCWIQHELSQLVSREDDHIGPYSFFHWDLVSSFLEFIVAYENGGEAAAGDDHDEAEQGTTEARPTRQRQPDPQHKPKQRPHTNSKHPFATWRRNMHALFDHFPTIEAHVRKRGRRRAEMCANGYHMSPTTGLGDQFDVVVWCEGVVGYDQVGSDKIRDACLGMIFRAMCWHRCHYMSPEDEPFRSDFYSNIQQVGIE
ncbi:hypothetical protein ASPACDRAFT_1889416 [Aspergillus aculeatus ATCC 16872]|uniref:Uncharacterized protein n=1 Tax=Aspergillus aculeatus (strain ATCC 16872 / CBS 172.66 / WB 5094) TaxID=690307 RepID=A0A1L9WS35_ASPA1|nr:uncharacterized protein ASPACDRAFT_1889416 [Aspergillus aculeatus ATCC 16872]OJJ99005.1 hypothetical protein ASPACDRAFT_1889416 [Aspergillus aculeatus ATCC 16872]